MNFEKPYEIHQVKSSKWDKEYTVCLYETFSTCTCKAYDLFETCKHIKQFNSNPNLWKETGNL